MAVQCRVIIGTGCAATGEDNLSDPYVRKQLLTELAASRAANPDVERAGYIIERAGLPDTLVFAQHAGSTPSSCESQLDPDAASYLAAVAGSKVKGVWHTHPLRKGESIGSCPRGDPGDIKARGSTDISVLEDATRYANSWQSQNWISIVIAADGVVWQFDPTHSSESTSWKFTFDPSSSDMTRCFTKIRGS